MSQKKPCHIVVGGVGFLTRRFFASTPDQPCFLRVVLPAEAIVERLRFQRRLPAVVESYFPALILLVVRTDVQVVFHRLAAREYRETRRRYKRHQLGLGAVFAAEVDRAVQRIAEAPQRWPVFRKNFRSVLVRRFPYVFYDKVINPGTVFVTAVGHARRRPGYWLCRT